MKDDFLNIRRFCLENGIHCSPANFYLTKNRDNPDKDDHNLTIDEIVSLATGEALLKGKELTPCDNPPEPGGSCKEAPIGLTCNAGRGAVLVSWDGTMRPCASLYEGTASLLEMSYAEAYEKTRALADSVLRAAECVGCPYDSACPKCDIMRVTSLYSGHCNTEVCKLARRLVAAGARKLDQAPVSCD